MELLIDKTILALKQITTLRFFTTERGFAAEFYKLLSNEINDGNLFPPQTIVEAEVQKRINAHYGISQRPDIIIHIPIETGLTKNANENNFVVYALKRKGGNGEVDADFAKLEEMFSVLNYDIGFFINIGAYPRVFLERYNGNYKNRIHELSIALHKGEVLMKHSFFKNNTLTTIEK